jgi:hypothetical protein
MLYILCWKMAEGWKMVVGSRDMKNQLIQNQTS